MSNLAYQLKLVGMEHRLQEVLEEAVRVRAEFGYPIMVTPLAQFVGSQAGLNVITGERYKQVSDEVIQYALGLWGREPVTHMDQEVRAKILDRPRGRELMRWTPPQPSLKEVRAQYGENTSDEELVLRSFGGDEAAGALGKASAPEDFLSARQPLVHAGGGVGQAEGLQARRRGKGRCVGDASRKRGTIARAPRGEPMGQVKSARQGGALWRKQWQKGMRAGSWWWAPGGAAWSPRLPRLRAALRLSCWRRRTCPAATQLSPLPLWSPAPVFQREVGVEDDPATFAGEINRRNGGQANPTLVELMANEGAPTLEWLADTTGMEFTVSEGASGHSQRRAHGCGGGWAFVRGLLATVSAHRNIEIRWLTPARSLVMDSAGAVTGVQTDGGVVNAGKVILATGGFGANRGHGGPLHTKGRRHPLPRAHRG